MKTFYVQIDLENSKDWENIPQLEMAIFKNREKAVEVCYTLSKNNRCEICLRESKEGNGTYILFQEEDITEIVNTFEDAMRVTGRTKVPEFLDIENEDEREYFKAHFMAMVVCEALNEGWKVDWMDTNQKKWRPWFIVVSGAFVFNYSLYSFSYADAGSAARLCLKNKKLSNYAGTQFTEIFVNILTK